MWVAIAQHLMGWYCHWYCRCVMVRGDIVIDRDINLASVRATSWDAVLPSSSFLHSDVSRPSPNHRYPSIQMSLVLSASQWNERYDLPAFKKILFKQQLWHNSSMFMAKWYATILSHYILRSTPSLLPRPRPRSPRRRWWPPGTAGTRSPWQLHVKNLTDTCSNFDKYI